MKIEQPPPPAPGAALTLMSLATRARIPVSAFIHLTSRCNLPCRHCYQVRDGTGGGRQVGYGEDMDTPTILAVLDELADMGCLILTLTGGEPLLRPDFDDIVRYARRRGFAVRLFTNGVLVDAAMADRIVEAAPHEVHVSVYGVTTETHETVTGAPGSFARTRRAVELLRERQMPVTVKCPVMSVNFHEWRALQAWAAELGCGCTFDATIAPREDGDLSPAHWRVDDAQLEELYAALGKDDIEHNAAAWQEWHDKDPDAQQDLLEGSVCGACNSLVTIVADGRVQTCQLMHVNGGSVTAQTLVDIWGKSKWFKVVRNISLKDLEDCRTCPDLPFCDRCGALARSEDGDALGPSSENCRQAAARRAVWEAGLAPRQPGADVSAE